MEPLYNCERTAEFLGITEKALEHQRSNGTGPPFIRVSSRAVRYRPSDIATWLETKRVDPTAVTP